MATEAQIKANRQNAQKSTGPRTEEGKETVSQNATKHGLCSCKNVIKSESQEEYNIFHDEMIEDLAPAGAVELMFAERIVNLSWRLKRAEVFQNAVIESMADEVFNQGFESYFRAREQAKAGDMSLLLGKSVRNDFANNNILEHLLIYEKRIESSLYKAAAELRKMQKLRREQAMMEENSGSHPQTTLDFGELSRVEAATRCLSDGREAIDESDSVEHPASFPGNYAVTRSQFTQEYRIQDTENSIENNEDCGAGLQSPCNNMENENDLKKQSQL